MFEIGGFDAEQFRSIFARREDHHYAQDEDTQGNRKTFQDHGQGKAASAQAAAQPPATQEIKTGSSLSGQRPASG